MPIIFNKKELEVEIARLLSDIENKIEVEKQIYYAKQKTNGNRSSCVNTPAFFTVINANSISATTIGSRC